MLYFHIYQYIYCFYFLLFYYYITLILYATANILHIYFVYLQY